MRRISLLAALALTLAGGVLLPGSALSARGVSDVPPVTPNLTGSDVNAYGGVLSGGAEAAYEFGTASRATQAVAPTGNVAPDPLRYGGVAFPE